MNAAVRGRGRQRWIALMTAVDICHRVSVRTDGRLDILIPHIPRSYSRISFLRFAMRYVRSLISYLLSCEILRDGCKSIALVRVVAANGFDACDAEDHAPSRDPDERRAAANLCSRLCSELTGVRVQIPRRDRRFATEVMCGTSESGRRPHWIGRHASTATGRCHH
jgi:hypothetical protein